ncbi:DUF429 domain-containing protein [Isoptericola croceus]|uniref:DUF429 domain-containing protein n=1 Tax=Isoptericola croceus TaxID=3031406 RepID=UPI0023F96F47|nr:DUF429 domain-containing protein [Isoptericola croceus]
MRSAGIDLSTDPRKTGVATIEWRRDSAVLTSLALGADDDNLVALIDGADKSGIDCPLGWPSPFVDYVVAHRAGGQKLTVPETRRSLLLRTTDRHTIERTGVRPLSVSADRIGATAMRCAALLSRLTQAGAAVDRSGIDGPVVEVYPAAALRIWGLPHQGYKGPTSTNTAVRDELVRRCEAQMPWLDLGDHTALCRTSDDALDAVVCAVLAGLAHQGLCEPVPPDALPEARTEGWIALPSAERSGQRFPTP